MSVVNRRFRFVVDDEIEKDIYDVYDDDPQQAAILVAIIEEIEGDNRLCERLVDLSYTDDQIESVKAFESLQREGYNAYTVRCWSVADWRIISAVDHRQRLVAVLYIMKRTEDYDQTVRQRVKAAYARLDLEQLGRRH